MSEGRMAFIGHRDDVAGFFLTQGHECPENYSPPDFFIKTLSISPFEREKCVQTVDVKKKFFFYFLIFFVLFLNNYLRKLSMLLRNPGPTRT